MDVSTAHLQQIPVLAFKVDRQPAAHRDQRLARHRAPRVEVNHMAGVGRVRRPVNGHGQVADRHVQARNPGEAGIADIGLERRVTLHRGRVRGVVDQGQGEADVTEGQPNRVTRPRAHPGKPINAARTHQQVAGAQVPIALGSIPRAPVHHLEPTARFLHRKVALEGHKAEQIERQRPGQLQQVALVPIKVERNTRRRPRLHLERPRLPIVRHKPRRIHKIQHLVRIRDVTRAVDDQRQRVHPHRQARHAHKTRVRHTGLQRGVLHRRRRGMTEQQQPELNPRQAEAQVVRRPRPPRHPRKRAAHRASHRQIRPRQGGRRGRRRARVGHRKAPTRLLEREGPSQAHKVEGVNLQAARHLQQRALVSVKVDALLNARGNRHHQRRRLPIVEGVIGCVLEIQHFVRRQRVARLVDLQRQRQHIQCQPRDPLQARIPNRRLQRRVTHRRRPRQVLHQHHRQVQILQPERNPARADRRQPNLRAYRQILHVRQRGRRIPGRIRHRKRPRRLAEGKPAVQRHEPKHIHHRRPLHRKLHLLVQLRAERRQQTGRVVGVIRGARPINPRHPRRPVRRGRTVDPQRPA